MAALQPCYGGVERFSPTISPCPAHGRSQFLHQRILISMSERILSASNRVIVNEGEVIEGFHHSKALTNLVCECGNDQFQVFQYSYDTISKCTKCGGENNIHQG